MDGGAQIKDAQRATWSAGDYGQVAGLIESASLDLVEALGIEEGMRVLDVACGSGNSAIPAAQRGATVVGLDLTPRLLELGRERAREAGVEVEFVEGDAENLPFGDGEFDRVISVFGAMFAPDQPRTAAELVRACAPGGRVGCCAWTPEGVNGKMFAVLGSFMPPPPPGFTPPVLWGDEDRVRELFAPAGGELELERLQVDFEFESAEAWLDFTERNLGPIVMAKAALEPEGRWEEVRAQLKAVEEEANLRDDGTLLAPAEYLRAILELPA